MNATFVPVILAGGSGERFWPLSTPEHPKQFLDLDGSGQSLLESTVRRISTLAAAEHVFIQTSSALAEKTAEHLPEVPAGNILAEPARRDTGPAIAWSALRLAERFGADAILGYFPADQWIDNTEKFAGTVQAAVALATTGDRIVTLGITPTRAATEYGYIECGDALGEAGRAVRRFTEKPDVATAQQFLRTGRYLWNAGMFIVRADVLLEAFSVHAPEILTPLQSQGDAGYEALPKRSIDYAVMEKSDRIAVVPADFGWDDLGDWNALARIGADAGKGVLQTLDSVDNVIYSSDPEEEIALVGVRDMVVVRHGKRTLVVPRKELARIKQLFVDVPGSGAQQDGQTE